MPAAGSTLASRTAPASARTAAMRKPKAPGENRAQIVSAAIDEFARRGFKGASMDAIAARTRTTRALINYYFGSKERLYIAVLEHVYGEIRRAEAGLDLDHLDPVDAMRRIVEFTFDYYVEHESFVRLIVVENQEEGRHLKRSERMRELNHSIIERISAVLERGQRAGRFHADIAPVDLHMAIAALGIFNVTNRHTFGAIFDRDMGSQGDVERRRETIVGIVLGYLTHVPGRPA